MFIKTIVKTDRKTDKRYDYYRLCQSYRIGDKTRHRTILNLGKLEDIPKEEHKLLTDCIENLIIGNLFPPSYPDKIVETANNLYAQLSEKEKVKKENFENNKVSKSNGHSKQSKPVFEKIDLLSVNHEDIREVGAEWLCYQCCEQLQLEEFLHSLGMSEDQAKLSVAHLISRAIFPESEHKTASWMQENSSVLELFGIDSHKINHKKLYKISQGLYSLKTELEAHLSTQTNELFDLDDKIILYDLTNTYFEGRKSNSLIAKFGKSKEKRSDARLIVLALVINREGFVKYSRICKGNLSDSKSLEKTIEELIAHTSVTKNNKPIIVIDAGISTDGNLLMLKEKGYDYLCVTRSKLKDYQVVSADSKPTVLEDNKGNKIETIAVERGDDDPRKDDDTDNYLYVRSEQKAIKESSMDDHFSQKYEEELDNVIAGIHKKGGTKKIEKVWERIGRIKERYPSANKHYNIEIKQDNGRAVEIVYSKKQIKTQQNHGVYFLRTSIETIDNKTFWNIYNTLTEIEATFRILKTDLKLRPVFHQTDTNTMAHLFLGVLAYTIVHTIRYQLKAKGINYDWKNIVRIMNTQKIVTTTMINDQGKKIVIRKCSMPNTTVKEIYQKLNYKQMPFIRKKIVLPEL